jgi:hypothetical protein
MPVSPNRPSRSPEAIAPASAKFAVWLFCVPETAARGKATSAASSRERAKAERRTPFALNFYVQLTFFE